VRFLDFDQDRDQDQDQVEVQVRSPRSRSRAILLPVHAALAAAPVVFLFWALAIRRWRGHAAAAGALAVALLVAILAFGTPAGLAILAVAHGFAFGIWPVAGIVGAAVLLYELVVATGELEVVKVALASATADRRIQALLVASGLGALLEGAAGFGTPVAIGGAMLAAMGFPPVLAATVALVGNTAGVGFGAIGIGMEVAGRVSGTDPAAVSALAGRTVPLVALAVPFLLVTLVAGARRGLEAWPAALASGGAFALTQGLVANLLGPQLADVAAALAGLGALLALLRVWRPRATFRFDADPAPAAPVALPVKRVLRAFTPFALLAIAVAAWSLRPVHALLDTATLVIPVPGLHGATFGRGPPRVALLRLDLLAASGTAVLTALGVSVAALGATGRDLRAVSARALPALARPILTISLVLGFAFLMNAAGMAAALGDVLAATGPAFPAASPVLGAISSSNALFVPLQATTAALVGASPLLAIAANVSGGVCAQMVTPQSMAVATAGIPGLAGREGEALARTAGRALALLAGVCALNVLLSGPLSWAVPAPRGVAVAPAAVPGAAAGWLLLGGAAALAAALALFARRAGRTGWPPHRDPGRFPPEPAELP
jgi:lactate permease